MIKFEYGGYSFRYNEFQNKLEVKCGYGELLLDAPVCDLGKIYEIHEKLDKYFDMLYHANTQGDILNVLKTDECTPKRLIDKVQEVSDYLRAQACQEFDEICAMVEGDIDE